MTRGLAQLKTKQINHKRIEFPLQWFTWYTGKPRPWKFTTCGGIFLNAYNLAVEQTRKKKSNIFVNGIQSFLEVENDQPIFMDSGGYQFLKRGIQPNVDEILDFQIRTEPDFLAVVDYPFSPKASTEEKLSRMQLTLNNIEKTALFVAERQAPISIVPVIHAHDERILEKVVKIIKSFERKYEVDFPMYAMGSMVYMVSATLTARYSRYYRVIDLILKARKLLDGKLLHVFGVGSPNVMYLLMYLGVDSIETFGWAGHGIHYSTYVAGQGTKAPSDRKRALDSEFDWDRYSCDCKVCSGECPIVNGVCKAYRRNCIMIEQADEVRDKFQSWKNTPILHRRRLHREWIRKIREDVLYTRGSWVPRACHNACIYSKEMLEAKIALKNGIFDSFIQEKVDNSLYKRAKLLEYAQTRIAELEVSNQV